MNINVDNIITNDLNGFLFSIMGMTIVFFGLLAICTYVIILPYLLELFVRKPKNEHRQVSISKDEQTNEMDEIMVAIATALHLEHGFINDNQKITWEEENHNDFAQWKVAGQMETFSSRNMKVLN